MVFGVKFLYGSHFGSQESMTSISAQLHLGQQGGQELVYKDFRPIVGRDSEQWICIYGYLKIKTTKRWWEDLFLGRMGSKYQSTISTGDGRISAINRIIMGILPVPPKSPSDLHQKHSKGPQLPCFWVSFKRYRWDSYNDIAILCGYTVSIHVVSGTA